MTGNWTIGKYIRLSSADEDVGLDSGKTESNSVAHQRMMIQGFVDADPQLKGCRQFEFVDDGFSGTNFQRPSFERMLEQIRKGEINCVIVKDFSRFGRNYIELGDYLERIFPFLGVRFISINDHFDSLAYKGTTGGLDVAMKTIVYDFYSKDLSVKVKSAKRQKMKEGARVAGLVAYGFRKEPGSGSKVVKDPETAKVVRWIFDETLAGRRRMEIVRDLNEKGVETPAAYFRRKHPESKMFRWASEKAQWGIAAVNRILEDASYFGAEVQHKRTSPRVGAVSAVAVPRDEWIIVEGAHEEIVTKDEWTRAQETFQRTSAEQGCGDASSGSGNNVCVKREYPLRGKVRCGSCGRAMMPKVMHRDKRYGRNFSCQHAWEQMGDDRCGREYIHEDDLNAVVWEAVSKVLEMADAALERLDTVREDAGKQSVVMAGELARFQKERNKCDADRFSNVDLFMAGELDRDVYQSRREELARRAEALDRQIKELEGKLREAEAAGDGGTEAALETVRGFAGAAALTQDMVQALIDKVIVYDAEHVEIRWKFKDEVMRFIAEAGTAGKL